jgi:hypothetical protein
MGEEQEENLLTIAVSMKEDVRQMRELTETMLLLVNSTSEKMLEITLNTIYDMYTQLNEMRKVLQWYAENQTGRKYTGT